MATSASKQESAIPLWLAGIALVLVYLLQIFVRESLAVGHGLRIAATLLLVATFAVFIVTEVRLLRRLDELHRLVQLEALAVAFPSAILLVFLVGHLRAEGFLANMDSRDLPLLLILPYGVGLAIAWRRYR